MKSVSYEKPSKGASDCTVVDVDRLVADEIEPEAEVVCRRLAIRAVKQS